jgi:hypothetical protein
MEWVPFSKAKSGKYIRLVPEKRNAPAVEQPTGTLQGKVTKGNLGGNFTSPRIIPRKNYPEGAMSRFSIPRL